MSAPAPRLISDVREDSEDAKSGALMPVRIVQLEVVDLAARAYPSVPFGVLLAAFNHIVEPKMLLWLIGAAGVKPALIKTARLASSRGSTLPGKSASIRRRVPWSVVATALWGTDAALEPTRRKS